MRVLVFEGGIGRVSKIMWVPNPMITAGRPCLRCHPALSVLPWSSFGTCPPATARCWPASVSACRNACSGCPIRETRAGVRHTLTSLLLTAVAAVLAGAQSLAAVGEWGADAPPQVPAPLGIRRDPLTRRFPPPAEATIRPGLEALAPAA